MTSVVTVLKAHARMLHRNIERGERAAIDRSRSHKDFIRSDDSYISLNIRRRHCLTIIANELGFQGWPDLLSAMNSPAPESFGTFFYPKRCRIHWNIWFTSYDEAAKVREDHGGFLLAYKNQFIVVDDDYIKSLGLNPDDADFNEIGRDWVRISNPELRNRLYGKIVEVILA